MLGEGEVENYSSQMTKSAREIISNIGKEGEPGAINETIRQLEIISKNLAAITGTTNQLMAQSSSNLKRPLIIWRLSRQPWPKATKNRKCHG